MSGWCCLLHLIKQNCLLKTFLRTLIFKAHVSFPVLPSRTNLKLNNVSVTPKMVKKLITNLDSDSSKTSGCDCFLVVVLNICDPERSYILAELFNMFLKESCFPDCWNVLLLVLCLRMLEKDLHVKTTTSVISRIFLVVPG